MQPNTFNILLVEDNPGDARLVELALVAAEGYHFQIRHVERLSQALDAIGGHTYDAVLLDLSLPDSHGLDTVQQLKQATHSVPIIVLTGLMDEALALEAVKTGAQDYLVKGQESGFLIARAIAYAIARKRAEEALRQARDELEQRVAQRTAELEQSNRRLQQEMAERKRVEEQERQHLLQLAHVSRLSTMGEMATEIAHELNQPLTAIASYSDACLRLLETCQGDTPDITEALRQISGQAERAGEVIRQLRAYVRKDDSQRSTLDINELVRDVAKLVAVEARQHIIAIQLSLSEDLPHVLVNQILIQQVLLNLMRNAIEAMVDTAAADGQLAIETALNSTNEIEVVVQDNGPGLSSQVTEHIFNPFYTTKTDGMGMGLAISQSIVQSHHGRLWVDHNTAAGCSFHFTLPLNPAEADS